MVLAFALPQQRNAVEEAGRLCELDLVCGLRPTIFHGASIPDGSVLPQAATVLDGLFGNVRLLLGFLNGCNCQE
jgi:hypothetical protein